MSFIFPHIEVLQEENLSVSSLPVDVQEMIEEFNELKAEYDQAPSEEGLDELKKESVKIADEIQDYIEESYEPGENDDESESSSQPSSNNGKAKWRFW